jgi:hypothetical protein
MTQKQSTQLMVSGCIIAFFGFVLADEAESIEG